MPDSHLQVEGRMVARRLDHEKIEKLEMKGRVERMEKNQARILELIQKGAKVHPGLLRLRKEDLPK